PAEDSAGREKVIYLALLLALFPVEEAGSLSNAFCNSSNVGIFSNGSTGAATTAPVEPLEKIPTLDELQKAFDKEPASSTGNKASNSAK
ncbi:hypothetical protein, partial [Oenococcus oeni]|uniref:hypothetical protein n=1 Tax=Oenococcus oeni TaxID=1247 RepID=UPI0015D66ED1